MAKEIKCSICEKPINKKDLMPNGKPDMINGAVIGKYIEVKGHQTCVHNVERIMLMENRKRIHSFVEEMNKELSKAIEEQKSKDEIDQMLEGILDMASGMAEIEPDKVGKA
jgi:hypothetical protein